MTPEIPDDAGLDAMDDGAILELLLGHGLESAGDREADIVQLRVKRDADAAKTDAGNTGQDGADALKTMTDASQDHGAGGALGDGEGTEAGQGAGPSDEPTTEGVPENEPRAFEFVPGATVFLFERNHHPETSELLDGYQAPKQGVVVKATEETGLADIRVGGEDSAPVISHDVPYRTQANEGENFWTETAE